MDAQALELAARFSCGPNALGLCGPAEFPSFIRKWFAGDGRKKDAGPLARHMKKFIAPYEYMKIIADANGLAPFDYEVVEAFWLGNKLLDQVSREQVASVITGPFVGPKYLSRERAAALVDSLPARIYPHHSFHVFYIGSISGVLHGTPDELDHCRVSWGKRMETGRGGKDGWTVHTRPLELSGGRASFGQPVTRNWKPWMGKPAPPVGATLCAHWNQAVMEIDKKQEKNLEKYTRINMELHEKRP